jgi:hypothetical protein
VEESLDSIEEKLRASTQDVQVLQNRKELAKKKLAFLLFNLSPSHLASDISDPSSQRIVLVGNLELFLIG